MQVLINGEAKQINKDSLTISDLLEVEKVESPEMVSVQVNGKVIDRKFYEDTEIGVNDEIDFLYFMGGGARR